MREEGEHSEEVINQFWKCVADAVLQHRFVSGYVVGDKIWTTLRLICGKSDMFSTIVDEERD